MLGLIDKQIVGKWWNMTKDKSLHLTPKQLGLEDNPMIKDADPLASDAGNTADVPMSELLRVEWKWHWRKGDDGNADCGIFAESHPGHAYAICRCPRYVGENQWREFATHICDLHNATLA